MKINMKPDILFGTFCIMSFSHIFVLTLERKIHFKFIQDEISHATVSIFSHCFSERPNEIISISNQSIEPFTNYVKENQINIITNFDIKIFETLEKFKIKKNIYQLVDNDSLFKLRPAEGFLLREISLPNVADTLHQLKFSIWWNVYGFFLIQKTDEFNSCSKAYDYLKILWNFNILYAIFLCCDSHSNIQIYTFNPYGESGPTTWTLIKSYKQENGHPLTLFKRYYNLRDDLISLCKELDYDKTRSLSGYPINICVVHYFYDPRIKNPYKIRGISGLIIKEIWTTLNITLDIIEVPHDFIVDNEGVPIGSSLLAVLNGKYDMHGAFDYARNFWRSELNLYMQSGICYITSKKFMTFNESILYLFSLNSIFTFFCIGIVIVILFAFCFKLNVAEVAMDVLRGAVGVAMIRRPKRILRRVLFIFIVIIVMIFNSFFQSHLSSLIVAMPQPKIENAEDIMNLDYKVYATNYTRQYFRSSVLYNHLHDTDSLDTCINLMKYDKKISCADDCLMIRSTISLPNEVLTAKDIQLQQYFVFLLPNDYALLPRIRNIYNKLYQHGIIKFHYTTSDANTIRQLKKANENILKNVSFRDIQSALYFLFLGLLLGVIVVTIEICISLIFH